MGLPARKISDYPAFDREGREDAFSTGRDGIDRERLDELLRRYPDLRAGHRGDVAQPGLEGQELPWLSREKLSWRTVEPGVVEVSVGLVNYSEVRTASGWLVICAAPFGAFADSHEVARVRVPEMAPGARDRIRERVPGADLGMSDSERLRTLMGEWIGNIDVYFEADPDSSVERHIALNLRVPPNSRREIWMCLRAEPYGDDYTAEIEYSAPGWRAEVDFSGGSRCGFFVVNTPVNPGSECRIEARIQRGRDGKVVPVEFTFEITRDGHDYLGCSR